MKLTVGRGARTNGFALPTILLVSTVMLTILVASVAAAAASRVSLDSQYYNLLAKQAAQSGIARATECLQASGYTPQWSTLSANRDLRPNSDCTGATMAGGSVSAYVVGDGVGPALSVRTRYSIEAPSGSGIGSILQVVGTTELTRTSSPNSVWRSYQQSLSYRIEAPPAIACPSGFASVPGDSRFGTTDFCISKYEAKNVGGMAASQAEGLPYMGIDQVTASTAASLACAGCQLVTPAQWLTVMHNALNVASNWSGGSVGSGYIYSGHNDNNPASAQVASTDDNNGYFNTNNSAGSNQRRTLKLSNGEVVWDMAGNAWEWTSGQVTGGQPGAAGYAWREWNAGGLSAGTFTPNPFPSFGTPAASGWTSTNGIGRLYSNSTDATLRGIMFGSYWNGGANAGLATLNFNDAPTTANSSVGFRMAFVPLSEITCSNGFIPVPGNSLFGTNNFCVSKYEAKNVGGTAASQVAGLPWVSVTQTGAVTAANGACATCRLINESEWLTIAHNIVNVPGNWSNGSVGNGSLWRGHSDSSPAARLAASSDDNDPYNGTGNSGNNQRRTHELSNGQIIWDFSGNVAEWTSATISGGQPGSATTYGWRDWNAIPGGGSPNPFPAFGTPAASGWTYLQNIGRVNSDADDATARGYVRGGSWSSGVVSGVFGLDFSNAPATSSAEIGFRIVEVK